MTILNRRTMLKQGAALALTTLPAADALAQIKLDPKIKVKIPPGVLQVVTRPNVSSLAANDANLEAYRTAIKAMKGLPQSDLRNWTKQAEIHNGKCPHRNWFFLPWHRAYLVAFERICRQLSGKSDFALPYWDWTAHPQLPAAFAEVNHNGQPNPLFDANRSSQTVSISSVWAGPTVMSQVLAEPTFQAFASTKPSSSGGSQPWRNSATEGLLESSPHDHVHIGISGDMATFMSPLDPIFWLHHCNIDRIWDRWNKNGHANTTDTSWLNMTFTNHFANATGTPFTTKVSENLNIGTLGYKYPTPIILPPIHLVLQAIDFSRIPPVMAKENPGVLRMRTAVQAPVTLNQQQMQTLDRIKAIKIAPQIEGAPKAKALKTPQQARAPARVIAFIRDVEPPKSGNADVRVFVDHPNLTAETPTSDPHYAGSFTFFGAGHAGHDGGTHSYMIDLTRTLVALKESPSDKINVQLIAVPMEGVSSEGFEVKARSIEVAIF